MMELSKRLQAVADLVTAHYKLADIGTDHAYIPIYLTQQKKITEAVALDVNEGPLQRAEEHIRENGLEAEIETRLSNGFQALQPGEVQSAVIAGMGGGLVIRILTEGAEVVQKLEECILQPQSEIEKVRAFLLEKGYEFLEEDMVCEDGKYYPMMKVRPPVADTAGEDTEVKCWDTVQLKYGKLLLEKQHPVLREYLEREIRIYQSILEGLKAKDSDRIRQRKEELEQELVEAEKGMKYYAVGLLAGRSEKEVSRIYLALDATDVVIDRAIKEGADMLITHHPLLFSAVKKVTDEDFITRRIVKLIQNDISYYAMHTNYDVLGMAELSGKIMDLQNGEVLDVTYTDEEGNPEGIGRIGNLEKDMTLEECCVYVKHRLELGSLKVFGDMQKKVHRLAISPGSGKSSIAVALEKGADVLVTGDIGHHDGIDAVEQGLAVIDAGHYGTEYIFIEDMKQFFEKKLPVLDVLTDPIEHPFQII